MVIDQNAKAIDSQITTASDADILNLECFRIMLRNYAVTREALKHLRF